MIDAKAHYQRLYEAVRGKYTFRAATKRAVVNWQVKFRRALRDALGLTKLHDDLHEHDARVEQITREDLDGYIRERWHIEVEPGLVLPFFVLLPEKMEGLRPLVLCPHGHNPPHIYVGLYDNEAEQRSIVEGERDIAVQAVREGYIVIAPTIGITTRAAALVAQSALPIGARPTRQPKKAHSSRINSYSSTMISEPRSGSSIPGWPCCATPILNSRTILSTADASM